MIRAIRNWWRGRYHPPELTQSEDVIVVGGGYYERPWLARVLLPVWGWLAADWRWTISIALTVVGIAIGVWASIHFSR